MDISLIEAGKDLYHGPLRTFFTVTLPATRAGLFGGMLLVFLPALGDFVSAQLLGGPRTYMIGNLVQQQFLEGQNWPLGSALTVAMMIASAVLMVIYLRATVDPRAGADVSRAGHEARPAGASPRARRGVHGRVLRLDVPPDRRGGAVQLQRPQVAGDLHRVQPALVQRLLPRRHPDPLAVRQPRHRGGLRPSARWCSARCWRSASSAIRSRTGRAIGTVTLLPLVTPEIVTGVAALLFFTGLGMKLSLLTVTLAEITFSIAYVTVIVRGRLAAMAPEVEEAARDLGCTPWQAVRLVILPTLAAGAPRRRAAGLRAGLRRLRAGLLHHRCRPAAAAGADLLLDPVRRLAGHQRRGHPRARVLGPADRGRPACCRACSTVGARAWTSSPEATPDDPPRDPRH